MAVTRGETWGTGATLVGGAQRLTGHSGVAGTGETVVSEALGGILLTQSLITLCLLLLLLQLLLLLLLLLLLVLVLLVALGPCISRVTEAGEG